MIFEQTKKGFWI